MDAFLGKCSSHVPLVGDLLEDPGHIKGTSSLGWPVSILGSQQKEVTGAREVWVSLLRLLPHDLAPDKWQEKEGRMLGFFFGVKGNLGNLQCRRNPSL